MNANKPNVLSSWKEIAMYLNKGIRTVQRWANERGLPVRRVGEKTRKSSVIATPEELDAWVRSQRLTTESDVLRTEVTKLRAELAECQRQLKARNL